MLALQFFKMPDAGRNLGVQPRVVSAAIASPIVVKADGTHCPVGALCTLQGHRVGRNTEKKESYRVLNCMRVTTCLESGAGPSCFCYRVQLSSHKALLGAAWRLTSLPTALSDV